MGARRERGRGGGSDGTPEFAPGADATGDGGGGDDPALAFAPQARALLDFARGHADAAVLTRCVDHDDEWIPAATFFEPPEAWPALERAAIERCRGRVLDLGAGAGRHALELQRRGQQVCALDVCDDAVTVMAARGVHDARTGTLDDLRGERFDTVLLLMHGVGVAGTPAGLDALLRSLHEFVTPGGRVLFDSREPENEGAGAGEDAGEDVGAAAAVLRFSFEYDGVRGPTFPWLFLGERAARDHARATGWHVVDVLRDDDAYLMELERGAGDGA